MREAIGFLTVHPGETVEIDRTGYSTHFLHVQNESGQVLIVRRNPVQMQVSSGGQFPFDELEASTWGDHHHQVSCN